MSQQEVSSSSTQNPALSRGLLIAFTLPTLVLGFTHGPEGQIQAIYAKHAALPLTAVALAMFITKVFDAITYPLIGYLSDRSYARRGTRAGWLIAGTLVSMLGLWFLLRPPAEVTVTYFGIWMSVTYVGWKLMEIPLQAWSYGLSSDYVQRSRVQAWRLLAALIGQLLFVATPVLAVQLGQSDSTELDFRSLGVAAIICVIALPLATLVTLTRVPRGEALPPPKSEAERFSLTRTWKAVVSNGPMMRLLATFLPVNLLALMSTGVSYLFIDSYLHLGKQFPALLGLALITTAGGVPFWAAMGARYERHRVLAIALIIAGTAAAGCAFIEPGPYALVLTFVLFPILCCGVSAGVLVFAICGDIVDYGRLKTGEDLAGVYSSALMFLQKSLGSLSAAAALAIAGWLGFEPTAATQTAGGVLGIKLTAAVLPAIGLFTAAAVIWNFPLTRARHAEIRQQLLARQSVA